MKAIKIIIIGAIFMNIGKYATDSAIMKFHTYTPIEKNIKKRAKQLQNNFSDKQIAKLWSKYLTGYPKRIPKSLTGR